MPRRALDRFITVLWETPTWVFLLVGMAIVSGTLLVGPCMENRQLAWQRDLLAEQARRLGQQEAGYRYMLAALEDRDPVLIQRLAFHYLHLKPAGAQLVLRRDWHNDQPVIRTVSEPIVNIEYWLDRPMPRVGVDFPGYSRLRHHLVDLATGPMQLTLTALGAACLLLGLIPLASLARRPHVASGRAARSGPLDLPTAAAIERITMPTPAAPPTLIQVSAPPLDRAAGDDPPPPSPA